MAVRFSLSNGEGKPETFLTIVSGYDMESEIERMKKMHGERLIVKILREKKI